MDSSLIKSSFSRVGLSLPIDGSKDYLIKIQAAEHLNFEPVLLPEEVNSSGQLDQQLKPESSADKLIKQLDNNQSAPIKQKKPISVEAQRARDLVFADPPESTFEEKAFELFESRYYKIEEEMETLEDLILRCENKFFDDYPETDELFPEESNLDAWLAEAVDDLDSLKELISETRVETSLDQPYERFSIVVAILMYADPIPDGIVELEERLEYITKRYL